MHEPLAVDNSEAKSSCSSTTVGETKPASPASIRSPGCTDRLLLLLLLLRPWPLWARGCRSGFTIIGVIKLSWLVRCRGIPFRPPMTVIPPIASGMSLTLAFSFLVSVFWWCGTSRRRSARFCGWATKQSLPYFFVFPLLLLSFLLCLRFPFLRRQFRCFSFFLVRVSLVISCGSRLRLSRCDLRLATEDCHARFEFAFERYSGGAGFEKVESLRGFAVTNDSILDTKLL